MKLIKSIAIFPLITVLWLVRIIVDLIVKIECWIAGVGFLLLAIFDVLAILNRQWLQLTVFVILSIFIMPFLFIIILVKFQILLLLPTSSYHHHLRKLYVSLHTDGHIVYLMPSEHQHQYILQRVQSQIPNHAIY